MDKVNVLIVDNNDLDVRMRLKHAINSTSEFDQCNHSPSCNEALAKLSNYSTPIDLVFVSYHFSIDQVREFALAMREVPASQDAALITLLPSGSAKDASLGESMLAGVDGFLMEPYSCDDLVKMTRLACRVNKERSTTREYVAIKFLVKDQIRLLDAVCCLMRGNVDASQTLEKFRALCTRSQALQGEAVKAYCALLIDACERSFVPIGIPKNLYAGKSQRAKRKVDQLMVARVETPKAKLDPKIGVIVAGKMMKLPPLPED